MASGLLLAVLTLFMAPMSMREISTEMTRERFVADELVLEHFNDGRHKSRPWMEGRLASTGEWYRTEQVELVGLDRLRQLWRAGQVKGLRVFVWYLPPQRFWSAVDKLKPFRVRSRESLDLGFWLGGVVANGVVAGLAFLLIRRGMGPRPAV